MEVAVVAVVQTVGYILLSIPDMVHRRRPEPIATSPLRGIVVGPVLEELVFRGIPLLVWVTLGHNCGLLMAGVLTLAFVAGHWYQADPEDGMSTFINLGWKLLLAGLWTWVALATGSLAWPIFLHALNNTIGYTKWHIQVRRWRTWVES